MYLTCRTSSSSHEKSYPSRPHSSSASFLVWPKAYSQSCPYVTDESLLAKFLMYYTPSIFAFYLISVGMFLVNSRLLEMEKLPPGTLQPKAIIRGKVSL